MFSLRSKEIIFALSSILPLIFKSADVKVTTDMIHRMDSN